MKAKVNREDAISSWLIVWAGEVLNRFKVQARGRTSYELMTQHRCRHKVAAFGEKVHFQHTLVKKDDYRKDVGVLLGMMDRSNTYIGQREWSVFESEHHGFA